MQCAAEPASSFKTCTRKTTHLAEIGQKRYPRMRLACCGFSGATQLMIAFAVYWAGSPG